MRLTPEGRERAGSGNDAADRPSLPPQTIDPRDAAFAAQRLALATDYPIDPEIGELRTSGLSLAERAARDAALAAIERASSGDVDETDVTGEGALFGLREIAEVAVMEPDVRLGRPARFADGEISFEFRVLGVAEEIRGEVIMETVDGRWYISDVQLVTLPRVSGSIQPGIDAPGTAW